MTDNSFTGQDDFDKKPVNTIEVTQEDCPYGDWEVEIPIWRDTSSSDVYGFGTHVEMYPGPNECGTTYENDNLFITHDWSENDVNGQSVETNLGDHRPEGSDTGSFTINGLSISYESVGLSWDYQQPDVERYDNTQNTPAIPDWDYYFNNVARVDPIELETASITDFQGTSPDSGDIIATAKFDFEFKSGAIGKTYSPEYSIVPNTTYI